jgi:hypothetical protein
VRGGEGREVNDDTQIMLSFVLFIVAPTPKNFVVKERKSSLVKASQQTFYTEFKNETGKFNSLVTQH